MITHKELLERLHYDPLTGIFTWLKVIVKNQVKVGDRAGFIHTRILKGVIRKTLWIKINGRSYSYGMLAWFYMKGVWPTYQVDHIDVDQFNNIFTNLRDTPYNAQNNIKPQRNNSSGSKVPNVYYESDRNKYSVKIKGKRIGSFDTLEEAEKCSIIHRRLILPGNTL